jgi:hypothetical protein
LAFDQDFLATAEIGKDTPVAFGFTTVFFE